MSAILFQYATLRYIHDPATQEFLNIGVVLYAKEQRYFHFAVNKRYGRLSKTFETIDRMDYGKMIGSLENRLSRLSTEIGKVTLFDEHADSIDDLLAKVLPKDDSSLRFDGFGAGLTHDLDRELSQLYTRLVEKYEARPSSDSRPDEEVWRHYARLFDEQQISKYLEAKSIGTEQYSYVFSFAYKNEKWHPLEAVSLDMTDSGYILEKANKWIGRATLLQDSDELASVYLLLGKPQRAELLGAYETAVQNLALKAPKVTVVREEEAEEFSRQFAHMVQAHEEEVS